jgi:hypothetical protein
MAKKLAEKKTKLDDQGNVNAKKQDYWLRGTITTNRFGTLSEENIEEEAKQSLRYSKHKPKGSSWNFEDKMLALSLLKRIPTSYSFLWLPLPLPSRRTLQSVLNAVHFAAGINAHVFGALQHSAENVW